MEFFIIEDVLEQNKRSKIYIPKHKKYVELTSETIKEDGTLSYEVVRLNWREEFSQENYLEENFDTLYVKPKNIVYETSEMAEEVFNV